MNRTVGLQLIAYSLLLPCASYITYHLSPEYAQTTLITGLAGAALCFVWGILAMQGSRRKMFPVMTLIIINYVLLGQVITVWMEGQQLSISRGATWMVTLLFVASMAMLMRIVYSGVLFDLQPTSDKRP